MLTIEQSQPHPDGLIREAAISDLFFNHEHDNLNEFYRKYASDEAGVTNADSVEEQNAREGELERAALLLDAKDFASTLDNATGLKVDPEALVADFFNRV